MTENGSPKLLDFGLARGANDAAAGGGTLRYLSPEVLSGRPAGEADDVWSLCVLLYELASGEHPFAGDDVDDVAIASGASGSVGSRGRRPERRPDRRSSRSRRRC